MYSNSSNATGEQPFINASPLKIEYPADSDHMIDDDDDDMALSTWIKGIKRSPTSISSEKSVKGRRVSSKRKKVPADSSVEEQSSGGRMDSDFANENDKSEGVFDKDGEEINKSSDSESEFQVPHRNPDFYYKIAQDLWKSILGREVRSEITLDVASCKEYGVYQFLEDRNFLGSVMSVEPYVELVVKAFYANLGKELSNPASKKFGCVFVRNKVYNFSPAVINDYFGMSDHDEDSFDDSKDEIISFLTGGNLTKWKPGFAASKLTSLYSVLHKIAIHNWTPSRNETVVTYEQALLLYKLGRGYNVNFGRLVFGNVSKQAEKSLKILVLPYPSLIYGILVSQGFQKEHNDFLSKPVESFVVVKAYLADHKFIDLPWKKKKKKDVSDAGNKASNTSAEWVSLSRKAIEAQIRGLKKQIRGLEKHTQELTSLKNALESHLSSQNGGEQASDGDDDEGCAEDRAQDVDSADESNTDA